MNKIQFETAFEALTRNPPFPWQQELFTRCMSGTIERSLDIPTGLGKTAVMAIWLIARALGASLPRRLIYVVDRRAVVDQATEVAIGIREHVESSTTLKQALKLGNRSLPISTLRGQHVDNKEWLEDPASPAIVVGTIDMIGSRLLFEGYGTSRKMRPYHAGLLGADTLVVLDEAHLVPPFEMLLNAIATGRSIFGQRNDPVKFIIPAFRLMSLSATGRSHSGKPFTLTDEDLKHCVVNQRLDAKKRLSLIPLADEKELSEALAGEAWKLTQNGTLAVRVIVFCDKRKDAEETKKAIERKAKGDKDEEVAAVEVDTELFVGGRRVYEREAAAARLKELGFIAGTKVTRSRPAFVFATSAGEVGVDLDADHMVSDLVEWERMVQRLGRVNRRGEGDARVIVVVEPDPKPKKQVQDALEKKPSQRSEKEVKSIAAHKTVIERFGAIRKPFEYLPSVDDTRDASPGAIRNLKQQAEHDEQLSAVLDAATTPVPLRPALTRPLVDAWSMTSLKEHTGRPEIGPWLRGWIDDDPPQTSVVWRTHLPTRMGSQVTQKEIEAFFEAAPSHASEVLETEMFRVVDWLTSRALVLSKRPNQTESGSEATLGKKDVVAIVLTDAGDFRKVLSLRDCIFEDDDKRVNKARKEELGKTLAGATLVVDARWAGLKDGLLDHAEKGIPRAVDDGQTWLTTSDNEPVVRFRVRSIGTNTIDEPEEMRQWQMRLRFPTVLSDDGEPLGWLVVQKWRSDSTTEEDRAVGHPQLLDAHQKLAEKQARGLAERLGLPEQYAEMLGIAARLHDEGKKAKRWQRAFNAPGDGIYAKTVGPLNVALLDGYRHEFSSLAVAAKDDKFLKLPLEIQELALHLIAAHHGFARPVIGVSGCEDAPPSKLEERAREVALRFARLQRHWGPWGLAWWESLLRAADQQASRDNDAADVENKGEKV